MECFQCDGYVWDTEWAQSFKQHQDDVINGHKSYSTSQWDPWLCQGFNFHFNFLLSELMRAGTQRVTGLFALIHPLLNDNDLS